MRHSQTKGGLCTFTAALHNNCVPKQNDGITDDTSCP